MCIPRPTQKVPVDVNAKHFMAQAPVLFGTALYNRVWGSGSAHARRVEANVEMVGASLLCPSWGQWCLALCRERTLGRVAQRFVGEDIEAQEGTSLESCHIAHHAI